MRLDQQRQLQSQHHSLSKTATLILGGLLTTIILAPARVEEVSELQVLTPFPRDPLDPLDQVSPAAAGRKFQNC